MVKPFTPQMIYHRASSFHSFYGWNFIQEMSINLLSSLFFFVEEGGGNHPLSPNQ